MIVATKGESRCLSKSHRVGGDPEPMLLKHNYIFDSQSDVFERKNDILAIDKVMFAFNIWRFVQSVFVLAIENVVL